MLKREWSAKSNGKHLLPEFKEEDLLLGRTAALVPEIALKDLPLGRTLMIFFTN